jgi:hypothetical protein
MKSFSTTAFIVALGSVPAALAAPQYHPPHFHETHDHNLKTRSTGVISLNSHVQYSSSMGVLGCMINTNRIAYWPLTPPCDNPCVKLTAPNGNTINVLHIDTSGGSYDISMDAYKTLKYGPGWRTINTLPEAMWDGVKYEYVPIDQCADILHNGKLPVMAKSPNKHLECKASSPASIWATGVELYDIDDTQCLRGVMQTCQILPGDNNPKCANGNQAGYSGNAPLVGINTVTDVSEAGVDQPVIRPAA